MMRTRTDIRFRKLVSFIDEFIASNICYDDEVENVVISVTAEECYNHAMNIPEFHLLGETCVRELSEFAVNDYDTFFNMLHG